MTGDYVVTCIRGFRRGSLDCQGALDQARKIVSQWQEVGVIAIADIWYYGKLVQRVAPTVESADGTCGNCGSAGFSYEGRSGADGRRGYECMTCGCFKPERKVQ